MAAIPVVIVSSATVRGVEDVRMDVYCTKMWILFSRDVDCTNLFYYILYLCFLSQNVTVYLLSQTSVFSHFTKFNFRISFWNRVKFLVAPCCRNV